MTLSLLSLALCGAFHYFIYWLMSSVCTEAGPGGVGVLTDLLQLPVLTVNPRLLSDLRQMELPAGRSGQLLYFLE